MLNLRHSLANYVRSSAYLSCAYYVASDFSARLRFRSGNIATESGTIHTTFSLSDSSAYIDEVFADYKKYGGVTRFHGRVAELGPGDNCGVGLMFLADGSVSVDLVDRFYSRRDPERHAQIYRALRARHPRISDFVGSSGGLEDEQAFSGITRWYGPEAAAESFFLEHRGYDYIVSRAVLEHLYDPLTALERMSEALVPGGLLLHKVDLRDHALFSRHFHELKFLEIPDWLYPLMTRGSGRPNRVLLHHYKGCLAGLPLASTLLVTRLAGVGDIVPHVPYQEIALSKRQQALDYVRSVRPGFAASLQEASDEDLSVAGVFIVAKRELPARDGRLPYRS